MEAAKYRQLRGVSHLLLLLMMMTLRMIMMILMGITKHHVEICCRILQTDLVHCLLHGFRLSSKRF